MAFIIGSLDFCNNCCWLLVTGGWQTRLQKNQLFQSICQNDPIDYYFRSDNLKTKFLMA